MTELTYETYQRRAKKPGPTARARAKRKRADDAERLQVRAACVLRDGRCKFAILGDCAGRSQHAHLGRTKRARTRNMDPKVRHTMQGSCMACEKHHLAEERGRLRYATFADLGANGPMRVEYQGRVYMVNG